eukprot:3342404-Amphidinium_carterae.1
MTLCQLRPLNAVSSEVLKSFDRKCANPGRHIRQWTALNHKQDKVLFQQLLLSQLQTDRKPGGLLKKNSVSHGQRTWK